MKQVDVAINSALTLWEPVYEYIVPRFRPKTSSFRLLYQCHISPYICRLR